MSKTVCIVGRPNVGKSTLFNKIVQKRIAITEDTPGVDIAVDHADVVIFLIDGVSGITSTDQEIARMLFRAKKEVILAVNKADTKGVLETQYDYYELGFGDPFMISAENNIGLGDLLDKVIEGLDNIEESEEEDERIKVAFIGKPNVGKSSIVNRLIGEERSIVTNIPGTTRDSIDSKLDRNGSKYLFIDTAGLRKKKKIYEDVERYSVVRTLASIDRSDVCVGVIDAVEGISEQDSKIIGYAHDAGKALIIAVNKWDLIEKDTNTARKFEIEIREELGFCAYAPVIFISGQRLDNLLNLIDGVNENYNLRIQTGVLNDIINKAILMNQPRADKGRQGKIYYASQVAVRPPTFLVFVNDKELIHFSYIRYLENELRSHFGFEGTPIKMITRERNEKDG